jgi:hypothetical protein
MPCENCDCADDNEVRSLKRRIDELEQTVKTQGAGILKVAKLIDDVSRDLKKRYTDLETELTYHTESPHGIQLIGDGR